MYLVVWYVSGVYLVHSWYIGIPIGQLPELSGVSSLPRQLLYLNIY